jgi:pilus assembly protein CpaB
MDSRPLKLLAAVTAVAALLFGYLAWVTSREESANQQALPTGTVEPANWPRVVIAGAKIDKGRPVPPQALRLVAMQSAPAASFTRLEEVAGQAPAVDIAEGELITRGHFASGSALAHDLGSSERAVAIQVNDVIGVGGLLQAGDFVDVVAFVAADGRQVTRSQARIILEHVRILATGGNGSRGGANTAVLAVPAAEVTRLVLASNAGSLRLALHGSRPTPDAHPGRVALLRELEGPVPQGGDPVVIIRGGSVSRAFQ